MKNAVVFLPASIPARSRNKKMQTFHNKLLRPNTRQPTPPFNSPSQLHLIAHYFTDKRMMRGSRICPRSASKQDPGLQPRTDPSQKILPYSQHLDLEQNGSEDVWCLVISTPKECPRVHSWLLGARMEALI
ncbi:hypothetical protein LEMLEM_LOCUS4409 [Lemmus lemmus]